MVKRKRRKKAKKKKDIISELHNLRRKNENVLRVIQEKN